MSNKKGFKRNVMPVVYKIIDVLIDIINFVYGSGMDLYDKYRRFEKKRNKGKRRKKYNPMMYFGGFLVYMELMFHLLMVHKVSLALIYPVMFAITLGMMLGTICRCFPAKVGKILLYVFTIVICILFGAEVIYKNVFNTYFALFGVLGVAGQAFDFMSIIFATILHSLIPVIFLFVLPLFYLFRSAGRKVSTKKRPMAYNGITFGAAIAVHLLMFILLFLGGRDIYSGYDLYFKNFSVDQSIETLGVTCTTHLSGRNMVFGGGSSAQDLEIIEEGEEQQIPVDTSPNILNVDFDKILADSGNNSEVESLISYIQAKSGTAKNEYTGMFEGYNLIWITAEGLDKYCITPQWCPNMYKLMNNGFVFKNYYSPLWYGSTSGGEWANLTGTVPNNGSYVSMEHAGEIGLNMLFTAGRQSTRLGQYTTGWHNNDYKYYGRNLSFPNMGYEWHGTGQGYEPEQTKSGKNRWPQSDRQLVSQSFPTLTDKEPFTCYYITVSGHVEYNFSGNAMCMKNEERVAELEYSDTTKAYIACQMELDDAIGDLMQQLKDAGIADRTLIVLAPDHVPYANMEIIDELTGKKQDEIDAYRNSLIIYSTSMEEPVVVDKYCSSIDILPTVSNLMGWDYDSRMMVGQDILSPSEQFIMFPGLSWITDKYRYNAKKDSLQDLKTGEEISIPDEEFTKIKKKAYSWYTFSDMLYDTDFYKYVETQMPEISETYQQKVEELRAVDPDAATDEDADGDSENQE